MIIHFRHKGLQFFFETGSKRKIKPEHEGRLRVILARLEASHQPEDMNLPGLKLHQLGGELNGHWSVWVSGNWRMTFRFQGKDAVDVDYLDYH
ncbi:MAG: type II toxin-antitoxin system RelE/ParE family toxin [Magnetococcales bacterium]|nr:type II toxin-antitoxin system RelE/ParE family toxin [Magnetococcales bacterium]MBF0436190.1 type II toxin-antitoxin system RelE/ParE family toxin [Magnetococcales bacterium]